MNGVHDMGGMQGMGRIEHDANDMWSACVRASLKPIAHQFGPGDAAAVLGLCGAYREHVVATGASEIGQADDTEGAGVDLRHSDAGIENHRAAVPGERQVGPVDAGRVHRARESHVERRRHRYSDSANGTRRIWPKTCAG